MKKTTQSVQKGPTRKHRLSAVPADKAPPAVEAPKTPGELTTREQSIAEFEKMYAEYGKGLQQACGVKGLRFAGILLAQSQAESIIGLPTLSGLPTASRFAISAPFINAGVSGNHLTLEEFEWRSLTCRALV